MRTAQPARYPAPDGARLTGWRAGPREGPGDSLPQIVRLQSCDEICVPRRRSLARRIEAPGAPRHGSVVLSFAAQEVDLFAHASDAKAVAQRAGHGVQARPLVGLRIVAFHGPGAQHST